MAESGERKGPPSVPGYTGLEEIARGGFAVVYKAKQASIGRDVAIKVIARLDLDGRDQQRFERECRVLGDLSWHPHIVVVFDAGSTEDGMPFLAMEYLSRGSLGDRLAAEGRLPWQDVVALGVQLSGALEAAHRAGVIHRDLKPRNVLLGPLGEAKLSDFGIALTVDGNTRSLTGQVSGTMAHVPPEILNGKRATVRTDVYSLASTLYELLEGQAAFVREGDESVVPMITRIATEIPASLAAKGVPVGLDALLQAAMAKDPDHRPASALVFGETLQAIQADHGLAQSDLYLRDADAGVAPVASAGDSDTDHITVSLRGPSNDTTVVGAAPLPPPPGSVGSSGSGETVVAQVAPAIQQPEPSSDDDRALGSSPAGPELSDPPPALSREPGGVSGEVPPSPHRGRAPIFIAAAVAALILLGAGAFVLFGPSGSDEADGGSDRPTTVSVDLAQEISLDRAALGGFDVGDGSVWLNTGNAEEAAIERVDPASGSVVDRIDNPGNNFGVSADDQGHLWIGSGEAGNELARIDTTTDEIDDRVAVTRPDDPDDGNDGNDGINQILVGLDAVWVTTAQGEIAEVDPETLEIRQRKDVGRDMAGGVGVSGNSLWAVGLGDGVSPVRLIEIDPVTLEISSETDLPQGVVAVYGFASDDESLWFVANLDDGRFALVERDTASGEFEVFRRGVKGDSNFIPDSEDDLVFGPGGLALDEESVWFSNPGGQHGEADKGLKLARLDRTSGEITNFDTEMVQPFVKAVDGQTIWVLSDESVNEGVLYEVDITASD